MKIYIATNLIHHEKNIALQEFLIGQGFDVRQGAVDLNKFESISEVISSLTRESLSDMLTDHYKWMDFILLINPSSNLGMFELSIAVSMKKKSILYNKTGKDLKSTNPHREFVTVCDNEPELYNFLKSEKAKHEHINSN